MTTSIGQAPPLRWRELIGGPLWALVGLTAAGYVLLVAALAHLLLSPTGRDGRYAVLMPPWSDYRQAVALATAADALVIDRNDRTGIVLVSATQPDAVQALYRSGAWMVLDPGKLGDAGLGGLCTSQP